VASPTSTESEKAPSRAPKLNTTELDESSDQDEPPSIPWNIFAAKVPENAAQLVELAANAKREQSAAKKNVQEKKSSNTPKADIPAAESSDPEEQPSDTAKAPDKKAQLDANVSAKAQEAPSQALQLNSSEPAESEEDDLEEQPVALANVSKPPEKTRLLAAGAKKEKVVERANDTAKASDETAQLDANVSAKAQEAPSQALQLNNSEPAEAEEDDLEEQPVALANVSGKTAQPVELADASKEQPAAKEKAPEKISATTQKAPAAESSDPEEQPAEKATAPEKTRLLAAGAKKEKVVKVLEKANVTAKAPEKTAQLGANASAKALEAPSQALQLNNSEPAESEDDDLEEQPAALAKVPGKTDIELADASKNQAKEKAPEKISAKKEKVVKVLEKANTKVKKAPTKGPKLNTTELAESSDQDEPPAFQSKVPGKTAQLVELANATIPTLAKVIASTKASKDTPELDESSDADEQPAVQAKVPKVPEKTAQLNPKKEKQAAMGKVPAKLSAEPKKAPSKSTNPDTSELDEASDSEEEPPPKVPEKVALLTARLAATAQRAPAKKNAMRKLLTQSLKSKAGSASPKSRSLRLSLEAKLHDGRGGSPSKTMIAKKTPAASRRSEAKKSSDQSEDEDEDEDEDEEDTEEDHEVPRPDKAPAKNASVLVAKANQSANAGQNVSNASWVELDKGGHRAEHAVNGSSNRSRGRVLSMREAAADFGLSSRAAKAAKSVKGKAEENAVVRRHARKGGNRVHASLSLVRDRLREAEEKEEQAKRALVAVREELTAVEAEMADK
jgi:hypothetical protein